MRRSTFCTICCLLVAPFSLMQSVQSQQWSDLKLTVKWDSSKLPTSEPIRALGCGGIQTGRESLIVDPETNGIRNAILMLDLRQMTMPADKIHPDLRTLPDAIAVLEQRDCRFVPHILFMRSGQTIRVVNSDRIGHNAKFNFLNNNPVNRLNGANGGFSINVPNLEKVPVFIECNIHPWMSAFLIVTDHPYVGISDTEGQISIDKLPAGMPISFRIWHESENKSIEEVVLDGKSQTWPKGSFTLTLKEGMNDLGTLKLKPARFRD